MDNFSIGIPAKLFQRKWTNSATSFGGVCQRPPLNGDGAYDAMPKVAKMRNIDTFVVTYKTLDKIDRWFGTLDRRAAQLSWWEVIQQGLRQNFGRRRQDSSVAEFSLGQIGRCGRQVDSYQRILLRCQSESFLVQEAILVT